MTTTNNYITSNTSNIQINIPINLNNDLDNINYSSNDTDINNNVFISNITQIEQLENIEIILDKKTIKLMETNLNELFKDVLDIIEKNISLIGYHQKLNKQLIHFIKYIKFRKIIEEGSVNRKYNIEYFGIKNNINKLLHLIENKLFKYLNEYKNLLEKGPFN